MQDKHKENHTKTHYNQIMENHNTEKNKKLLGEKKTFYLWVMVNLHVTLTELRDAHMAGQKLFLGCVCEDVSRRE